MNLTFTQLRNRNNKALERAGLHSDEVLPPRQLRRLSGLLDLRERIERHACTRMQRAQYPGRWDEKFVRVREVMPPAGSRLSPEEFRQKLWNLIPASSEFKRFQELFCHPHDFIVPCFTGQGFITFKDANFENMSVQGCLISGDRIPDKLAQELGLCCFTKAEKGKPFVRLEMKSAPKAVQTLKLIWDSAKPIAKGAHRVLVVTTPDAKVQARYPEDIYVSEAVKGSIIYTREADTPVISDSYGPPTSRRKQAQLYPTIHAAHRKTLHERESYEKELGCIGDYLGRLALLRNRVNRDWTKDLDPQSKDLLRNEANELLEEGVKILKRCRNQFKVSGRGYLTLAHDLKDKRGRNNPSVGLNRMSTAIIRLQRRLNEIQPKSEYNFKDEHALQTLLTEQEATFKGVRATFFSRAAVVNQRLRLFSDVTLTGSQIKSDVRGLKARIGISDADLAGFKTRPFSTAAAEMRKCLAALDNALLQRSLPCTKQEMAKIECLLKLGTAAVALEHVKADMLMKRDFAHAELLLKQMLDFLKKPSLIQNASCPPQTGIAMASKTLQEILEACGHQKEKGQASEEAQKKLIELLSNADIEAAIRTI